MGCNKNAYENSVGKIKIYHVKDLDLNGGYH